MANLVPFPKFRAFDSNGDPLAGGKLYTYEAGTSTPLATYTDSSGGTANANPVVLNANGEANVWLPAGVSYKYVLKNSADVTQWTVDNIVSTESGNDVYATNYGVLADGATDNTVTGQAAIDAVIAAGGGTVIFPAGTILGNWVIGNKITIIGAGIGVTNFTPYVDAPVFKTPLTTSTTNFGLKDFSIVGDNTFTTDGGGIVLKCTTAGTWVDSGYLENIRIEDCGERGLYMFGSSTAGPFTQNITCKNVNVVDCVQEGLLMEGVVLEALFMGCGVRRNGGAAGTYANAATKLEAVSLNTPRRAVFLKCIFNHSLAMAAANKGTAFDYVGAKQFSFIGCDFEAADPMIKTSNAFSTHLTIDTCNFGTTYATDTMIELNDIDGLEVRNSRFAASAGVAVTNCIMQGPFGTPGATNRVKGIHISDTNSYGGTITKHIDLSDNVTIDSLIELTLDGTYVDCVAGDIGKAVLDDAADIGHLVDYDNTAQTWKISPDTPATPIADNSVMTISSGTGAGDASGASTAYGGAIYAYKDTLYVDSEAAAATDDLDYIYYRTGDTTEIFTPGQKITLTPANGTHTIVIKHNTGNIYTASGNDIVLDELYKTFTAEWSDNTSRWIEVNGSYNAAVDAITAFAGGGQTDATQLTAGFNRVTVVATAADSVKLPAAVAGLEVIIFNADSTDACDVFPASGDNLGAGVDTAASLAAGAKITYHCFNTTIWA